jgi:hypothetical protein
MRIFRRCTNSNKIKNGKHKAYNWPITPISELEERIKLRYYIYQHLISCQSIRITLELILYYYDNPVFYPYSLRR